MTMAGQNDLRCVGLEEGGEKNKNGGGHRNMGDLEKTYKAKTKIQISEPGEEEGQKKRIYNER